MSDIREARDELRRALAEWFEEWALDGATDAILAALTDAGLTIIPASPVSEAQVEAALTAFYEHGSEEGVPRLAWIRHGMRAALSCEGAA